MFLYALITFLFLFLVETSTTNTKTTIPCKFDNDCPEISYPLILMCIDDFCEYLLA
ncbi:Nodule Cysteine-Rich (NCR) secreted peptide [Medicago truncatula]|uniref:Nodule Cysteine-Rich (NCR) secreted peptide n=1 Tax=Medicago truncatula TaxID=3880 RepID=G7JRC1_MEDTR|nr:Nodule Cysteine-Rich (NCR) secreted peptide [Medicago truncatula]